MGFLELPVKRLVEGFHDLGFAPPKIWTRFVKTGSKKLFVSAWLHSSPWATFLRICQIPGKTWGCLLKDNFWGLIQLINVCLITKYLAQLFAAFAIQSKNHLKQVLPPFFLAKLCIFITFCCLHYPFLMQKLKKNNTLPNSFYHRIYLCVFIWSHTKMKSLDSLYGIITAAKNVRPPPLLLLLINSYNNLNSPFNLETQILHYCCFFSPPPPSGYVSF